MIRHLGRLLWNRRRHNALVVAEIFVSFLVLFAVVTLGVQSWQNARAPLGFEWQDRWTLTFRRPPGAWTAKDDETRRQVTMALRAFPEVLGVAGVNPSPYSDSTRVSATSRGAGTRFRTADASDEYLQVGGIRVVRGRWFTAEDEGAAYIPMVVTQSLADALFPGEDPIGKNLSDDVGRDGRPERERRIVGVVDTYRPDGEYMWPEHFAFSRAALHNRSDRGRGSEMVLHVAPGSTAALEQRILDSLRAVAPEWSALLRPQAELRAQANRTAVVPLVAVGIVAVFLMLMVFLGLSGVLWQAITQRTREIGLRRAKGATASAIYRQLLGEIGLLTTVAVAAGLALVVQLPWLDLVGGIAPRTWALSLAATAASIYVLTLACGLYPGHLATKLSPAEALHDE